MKSLFDSHGQRQRILSRLLSGDEVSAAELSRIGSGSDKGWCASFSRRISEIRDQGYGVTCRKEFQPDGSLHTFYKLTSCPPQTEAPEDRARLAIHNLG